MYWTLELASYLEDAPWPAVKDELVETPEQATENIPTLLDEIGLGDLIVLEIFFVLDQVLY